MSDSGLILITAPDYQAFQVVPLAEMKKHAYVDIDADDALILSYLNAAIEDIEDTARRAIAPQQWTRTFDRFPDCGGIIRLPKPPLTSVDEIRYVAADGTVTVLADTLYRVDVSTLPGQIVPAYGLTWPVTRVQPRAVEIDFTCGFATIDLVPFKVKAAAMLFAADLYRTRESQLVGVTVTDNPTVMRLLSKFLYREFV